MTTEPKYATAARKALIQVRGGTPARLDQSDRAGMVRELRAAGVEVSKERGAREHAARAAQAMGRQDAWSDEARAAAAEARRASAKAKEVDTPEAHREAAAAHMKAGRLAQNKANTNAMTGRNPAASIAAGDRAADKHASEATAHAAAATRLASASGRPEDHAAAARAHSSAATAQTAAGNKELAAKHAESIAQHSAASAAKPDRIGALSEEQEYAKARVALSGMKPASSRDPLVSVHPGTGGFQESAATTALRPAHERDKIAASTSRETAMAASRSANAASSTAEKMQGRLNRAEGDKLAAAHVSAAGLHERAASLHRVAGAAGGGADHTYIAEQHEKKAVGLRKLASSHEAGKNPPPPKPGIPPLR